MSQVRANLHGVDGGGRVVDALAPLLEDPPVVDRAAVEHLRAVRSDLEAAAAEAVRLVAGRDGVLPLRLPKSRVMDLFRCPRSALERYLAPDGEDAPSVAALRGSALDRFVAHQLTVGPVGDAVADLRAMLVAQEQWAAAEAVDGLGASAHELLDPLAAAAGAWAGVPAAWWPRTQVPAGVHLAGGAVCCSGVVDVELGGPVAGRPGVVVEVKAGAAAQDHLGEATHYALLVGLRDGVPPAAVARWYPGVPLVVMEVGAGVVDQAARRLLDAIGLWSRLLAGEVPAERPGRWCHWCPAADRCPTADRTVGPWDELDREWEPEVPDDVA